jgi:hypothetical protein
MTRSTWDGVAPGEGAFDRQINRVHHLRVTKPEARHAARFRAKMHTARPDKPQDFAMGAKAARHINILIPGVKW